MDARTEVSERWIRGYAAGEVVVDCRTPTLLWEADFPVPRAHFPRADVRTDLLRPSAAEPGDWSFFRPHNPVAQWFDLHVGGRVARHAAWTRAEPGLEDLVGVSWEPGVLDRWTEEDEEVFGHPRDPYKRVDALPSSRHVTVAVGGLTLADSRRPVILFETSLPTRFYLPREDVRLDLLEPLDRDSHCPYKGRADSYWGLPGTDEPIAWSYSAPVPAVGAIVDRVAFYDELVDVTLDGVARPRAVSVFSEARHREG